MIGLFLLVRIVFGYNVTEGEDFFVPCPVDLLNCYKTGCKNLNVQLRKSDPYSANSDKIVYQSFTSAKSEKYEYDEVRKSVKVSKALDEDEGTYICQANGFDDTPKLPEKKISISILIKPEILGIKLPAESDGTVRENSLKFTKIASCKVRSGKPPAKVTWYTSKGTKLERRQFWQTVKNVGEGVIINELKAKTSRQLNGLRVFCKVQHDLLTYQWPTPVIFNVTYPPSNIRIFRTTNLNEIMCVSDANPPAKISWKLKDKVELSNPILLREKDDSNFTYQCTATNAVGSANQKISNKDVSKIKKAGSNMSIYIGAISATVAALAAISIVVCRYAFKSSRKTTNMNSWSEPLPIQRVNQSHYSGSFKMKPSPPRTLPPDHSDSDSDTGGEIEWSDPQDFIRSDSIIQGSFSTSTLPLWRVPKDPRSQEEPASDIYPAYRPSFQSHSDYIPGNSFARSATRDFDSRFEYRNSVSRNSQHHPPSYSHYPLDQPSQVV